jgi:hypothetical protein
MFGSLIESIRVEALQRGSYASHQSTSAMKKQSKQGSTRYRRQKERDAARKVKKGFDPDNQSLPTRGTEGHSD